MKLADFITAPETAARVIPIGFQNFMAIRPAPFATAPSRANPLFRFINPRFTADESIFTLSIAPSAIVQNKVFG
tara:strand:- start:699 stop:920 length:222 start_codon:yes stop_codon:yes gene_type:complete